MNGLTTEFKVGAFAIVALGLLVYFVLRTDDRETSLFQKPTVISAEVDSVAGVQKGTAVEIAGVAVGSVGTIALVNGRAVVKMDIEPRYKLPSDTQLAMKTRGLLGDRFIQLIPGTSDVMLRSGDSIQNFDKGLDVDALTAKAERIADHVEKITSELSTLVSDEESKQSVQRIIENLDTLSAQLPSMAVDTQRDLDVVVKKFSVLTTQMQSLIANTNQIIERTGEGVDREMAQLQALTTQLNQAVGDIASITGKIERGEGTVGALLTDTELIERVNSTVADVQDLVGTVGRLKSDVGYRGEFFVGGSPTYQLGMRNTIEVTLMPREDYGYLVELVSDPGGYLTEEEVTYYGTWYDGTTVDADSPESFYQRRVADEFLWTMQFLRRWQRGGLRLGIKYGTGGVGGDLYLFGDRLALRADLFDFRRSQLPNLKLQAQLTFLHRLYLGVGVDDSLNGMDGLIRQQDSMRGTPWGPNVFLGGGFTFEDDDIKLLLTALPIP